MAVMWYIAGNHNWNTHPVWKKINTELLSMCSFTVLSWTPAFKMWAQAQFMWYSKWAMLLNITIGTEKKIRTLTSISVWKLKRSILCQLLPSRAKTFHACRKQTQFIYYLHCLLPSFSSQQLKYNKIYYFRSNCLKEL